MDHESNATPLTNSQRLELPIEMLNILVPQTFAE